MSDRSLGLRLFLSSGVIVLGAMLAAVGFTALFANQVTRDWVRDTLAKSSAAQARVEHERVARLRLVSRFAAGDPAFVAYVAESDAASVHDLLLERERELECDLLVVLDRAGRRVAGTERAGGAGADLSHTPLVADALVHGEAIGAWTDGERWWTAVAVPIVSGGDTPVGLLVAGLTLDDALALDVRRQSGAEVAYVARAPVPRVIASTVGDDTPLKRTLEQFAGRAGSGGAASRITVGGRHWALAVNALGGRVGDDAIAAVTLASVDQVLAPFRRIERTLAIVGLLSLLLAFAGSYALSQRIARPLGQLADAADAARAGHFDRPVPATGDGEVGRLARAFDNLLGELREERDMQHYLETLSRTLPDAGHTPPAGELVLPAGRVFANRFEIQSWLGSGGMAVVYRARDRQLNEVVALKTLRRELLDDAMLERFKTELRIARRVTHRNVLRTHDFGEADGVPFLSMEYVRGVTLRALLDDAPQLPVTVGLRLARQLLAGLDAAHALGVVHRDIKPENLILDATGQLKVMDFGIAQAGRRAPADASSGTFGYLAPEQMEGGAGDARADVYACGVVLYELLAGRRPYAGHTAAELFYRMTNEPVPPLTAAAPGVPATLAALIERCLARTPDSRPANAAALLAALQEIRA